MNITHTFTSFLLFRVFISRSLCLKLNVGKIENYSSGSTQINVQKKSEFQNFYTHKISSPITLTEIYNGNKRLHFDPLLSNSQPLISASVIWSFRRPAIIQLNLEKSSVLLLNEYDSLLAVQAIFSENVVTNLVPNTHSLSDVTVDVDLSQFEDYNSNDSKVFVTNLKFADERFKRFTLRNYNLESTKLGKLLYDGSNLKTVIKKLQPKPKPEVEPEAELQPETQTEEAQENQPEELETVLTDEDLEIPNKEKIYSVQVYSYNNFPLLIEFLYTFNKRKFYCYTPEEKWKHVVFPTIQDPTFPDILYNRLSYYGCKNGFKYTINIYQKTDVAEHKYKIENYCNLEDEVVTIENELDLPFYTDWNYKSGKYRCYVHIPTNRTGFFVDHLKAGSSVLQLLGTPSIIKSIRVYHDQGSKPYLIGFVDKADAIHFFMYQDKTWKKDKVLDINPNVYIDYNLKEMLDSLELDDTREGPKVPRIAIDNEAIQMLPDTATISTTLPARYVINTIKKDNELRRARTFYIHDIDTYKYNYAYDFATVNGELYTKMNIDTKENIGIRTVSYYYKDVMIFRHGALVHRIENFYNTDNKDITLELYTNTLLVYTFRNNYSTTSTHSWKFISVRPMNIVEDADSFKKYFDRIKSVNHINFDEVQT
ncbi:hypothetical protein MACK_001176 [Theileria orientalis]|uniref:SfiI-subtelomeric related protein family member n=1 Tax=Theileria orientalis TaxID=68886 RepID=A0A976ME49_THEOR|nr:hypothetical protein MACK_001176 [Theileria orientalis]